MRAGLRILSIGIAACVVIAIVAVVVLDPVTNGQQHARRIAGRDLPLQQQSKDLRNRLTSFQLYLEPALDAVQVPGALVTPTALTAGVQIMTSVLDQAKAYSLTLNRSGIPGNAVPLDKAIAAFSAAVAKFTPLVTGSQVSAAELAKIAASERTAFAAVWNLTTAIDRDITQRITGPDVRSVRDELGLARIIVFGVGGAGLLLALGATIVGARRAARRQRSAREAARRHAYDMELQQGMELSNSETDVYSMVGRGLGQAIPKLAIELLVADSSHAHFRRVLASNDDPEQFSGCGVVSPGECPATTRGRTMQFPTSEAISACPYLRDRPGGACSAVCVPVAMAGRTIGVIHATGPNHILPDPADMENLELTARRIAERVALLRTFETAESQARTDPLTGLFNRRSLENHVHDLQNDTVPYALAYGDLDHFKDLNDTHGHEQGDQALRLFSRVMRDAVRPDDIVSRYGGEEFVIVLPDCNIETAVLVLERVRERLALALISGRVPPFTVSFGVSTSTSADTFNSVVAEADRALLSAKAAGRNRIAVAGAVTETGAPIP